MSFDAWLTLGIVLLMLVSLALDRLPPVASVLGAMVALLVFGVIDEGQAFAGFSNPAPLTVAALYVLARAADKTGLMGPVISRLLGNRADAGPSTLSRVLLPSASMSAFINSTPVVAMLIPEITSWATKRGLSPSRFLLPLSYAAILGGSATVLGSSTNLVVSGLLEDTGAAPFGLFEISIVGGASALVGLVMLLTVIPRLVPERQGTEQALGEGRREFLVEMEVEEEGRLDGTSVEESGLGDLEGVYMVRMQRGETVFAPVSTAVVLRAGDRLTFAGDVDEVVDLQRTSGLRSTEEEHLAAIDDPQNVFFEAVIGNTAPLAGRTLDGSGFRARYNAAVVAIHRAGGRVKRELGEVVLRPGDTLLLLGPRDFRTRWREGRDFLLIARLGGAPPSATHKAPLVGAVAVALVVLAALEVLPILQLALLAAAAMVALRVLSFSEARNSIDLDVIVLIAAAFGVGAAIETTGLATSVADGLLGGLEPLGTVGIVLGVVLATSLLTEVITNNAAAAVIFPIALSIAAASGIDPRTMAIAIAVTASSSFLTPLGYQTNTMVYGPGGYRFGDYLRAGIPLNIAVVATITAVTTISA